MASQLNMSLAVSMNLVIAHAHRKVAIAHVGTEDIDGLVQRAGRPFPLPDDLITVSMTRQWHLFHPQ